MEKGAYFKFWFRWDDLIRKGGLTERGLNRDSTVI